MRARIHHPLQRERGAATLVIALVLLFSITFITLFASRAAIFEQKTSVNQYRATQSFEASQAGMELGLANLNVTALKNTYIKDTNSDGIIDTATNTINGSISGTSLTYQITYTNPTTGDLSAIKIASRGCADSCSPCSASCTSQTTINQLVQLQSTLSTAPSAALTAKGNVTLSGSVTVSNTDTATAGTTVHSGGTTTLGGSASVATIPGAPPESSIASSDTSLSSLSDDAFFQTYFGSSKSTVQSGATQISCSGTCNDQLSGQTGQTIWVTGNTQITSNITIGSATEPVILIVDGNLQISGGATIYGVVYCTALTWDNTGGGTSQVIGAAIAEGNFTATGTPNPTYNSSVLQQVQNNLGTFGKVAGGWSDY